MATEHSFSYLRGETKADLPLTCEVDGGDSSVESAARVLFCHQCNMAASRKNGGFMIQCQRCQQWMPAHTWCVVPQPPVDLTSAAGVEAFARSTTAAWREVIPAHLDYICPSCTKK